MARKLRSALLATGALAFIPGHLVAQEASTGAAPAQRPGQAVEAGEIIVTGSRIPRNDVEAASPVTVFDGAELGETSSGDISQSLKQLPAVLDAFGPSNPNSFGASTVALRGLGASRTLTLVNGRRYITADSIGRVDIATIAPELVQRVELVTGGASAVYGSDAVAGVVNFILRDDIRGIELNARAGVTDRGEGTSRRVSATAGERFADDRGRFFLHGSYEQTSPIYARARSFAAPLVVNQGGALVPLLDFTTNSGLAFLPDGTPAAFDARGELFGVDASPNAVSPADQTDTGSFTPLFQASDRVIVNGGLRFDLTDDLEFFIEGLYANIKLRNDDAPDAIDLSSLAIPVNSPFLGPATGAALADLAPGADTITLPGFSRRFAEIPARYRFERDSYRFVGGLRADLGDRWNLETYVLYQEQRFSQRNSGAVFLDRLQQGTLATRDPDGTIRCTDASGGCVPVNIFGSSKLSPAAIGYLSTVVELLGRNSDLVLATTASGRLLELPAGPVGVSAGLEYRRSKASETPDEAYRDGLTSRGGFADFAGTNEYREAFGEIVVPLVAEKRFAHYLGLEGGVRYSRFKGVGDAWTYKALAEYAPARELKFRGGFQRAVRAPNLFERFGSDVGQYLLPFDPCFIGEPLTGGLRTVCVAQGVPAAVADAGSVAGANVEVTLSQAGSLSLRPEKADSITAGMVVTDLPVRGLSFTTDYYRIKLKGAIARPNFALFTQCYFNDPAPDDPTCALVARNQTTGFITRIDNDYLNFGQALVEGIDVALAYAAPVGGGLTGQGARISLRVNANYQLANETIPFSDDRSSKVDCLGAYGDACFFTPKFSALANFNYSDGPFTLGVDWQWIGKARDKLAKDGDDVSELARTRVPDYHRIDVTLAIAVNERFTLAGGVENLFDERPTVVGSDRLGLGESAYNTFTAYDQVGRRFFVSATARF